MNIRANDALVGLITGAAAAGVATIIQSAVFALKLLSFGHLGGSFGVRFLLIVVLGAVIGAIIGYLIGAMGSSRKGNTIE